MRIGKSLCAVAGLAIALVTPAVVGQAGAIVYSNGIAVLGGITDAPYSATRKTTRVQTLADGTKITHQNISKEARDSAGRTYVETRPEIAAGADANDMALVNVFDPVDHVRISWSVRARQATVFHLPDPGQNPPSTTEVPQTGAPIRLQPNASGPLPQVEDLGTQTINGVLASGRRITRVIAAGKQGNDHPITITVETWRSPELRLVVRQIRDDPRSGVTTMELTDLQQGEPDPSLFQVPEGYTVKDRYPDQN